MRRLADQSIRATERIRDVLDGVSLSMREAARTSEQGEACVQVSLDAVRTSGAQLQELTRIHRRHQRQRAADHPGRGPAGLQHAPDRPGHPGSVRAMQRTLQAVEETRTVTQFVQALAEVMSSAAGNALRSGTLDGQPGPETA